MADVPQKKKGILGGGNLLPKILIIFAVGAIVSSVLFGLPVTIGDFIWFIIRIIVGMGILVFAIMIIQKVVLPSKQFSPTESWDQKLIRAAGMAKPPRTRKLWLRGEDGHMFYYFGRISGLLKVPHWSGKPVLDEKTGRYKYVPKIGRDGKQVYDASGNPVMINEQGNVTHKDFDWIFIITRGLFPALSKKIKVRCDSTLCSEIGEEVWIKDVNLVPISDWFYPSAMFQADILRVNQQSLNEIIQESMMHFYDMTATVVESTLRSDPMFMKLLQANTESISSKESSPIQSLGRRD
jgi:hypothetical protein